MFNAQELVMLTHKDANGNVYAKVLQIPGFQPMLELWVSAAKQIEKNIEVSAFC